MVGSYTKNIQFRVVIPANVKPGQMLRIRCPDGTEGDVRVPKGLKPGNSFIFEMPADALINKGMAQQSGSKGLSDTDLFKNSSLAGGFLDREIVDRQDFLAALAVGILVGLSIVAGFLFGVLIATEP